MEGDHGTRCLNLYISLNRSVLQTDLRGIGLRLRRSREGPRSAVKSVKMMVRNARSKATRNVWAQVGVSALVLLLPPIALGAAVYAMLPGREAAAVRPVAPAVADARPVVQQPAVETWPLEVEAQPPAQPTQPAAVAPQPRTAAAKPPSSFSLASARQESTGKAPARDSGTKDAATKDAPAKDPGTKDAPARDAAAKDAPAKDPGSKDAVSTTGKDTARVLNSVPVRVTVVTAPTAAAPPPAADVDSPPTGSINEPLRIAAAEMPQPALPLAQAPAVQESPTAQSPEAPAATGSRRHGRFSYLRHLARRNNLHAEARSEARTARWNARSDHAFSLRNWLNGIGTTRQRARS
jgi:hypothetical protein